MVAGIASIAGKGLQGYMQGRQIKKGEEKDAAAAKRQLAIDALNEERTRAAMANDAAGLGLRRQELALGQQRFEATHSLAQDRAAREAETHGFAVDGLRRDAENADATSQIMSGALAETLAEAERTGAPVGDLMGTFYAPRVRDGILATTGDLAAVKMWDDFATSAQGRQHMETWDQMRFALEGGDFDTAINTGIGLYNDMIPDGYAIDKDVSGAVKDSQGNIIGVAMRFTGPDGQVNEQFFENTEDFLRSALPQLDPVAAFEAQMDQLAAADSVRSDLSADQRERLAQAREAVVKLFSRENVVAPATPEERAQEAAEIYRTYGFDPEGNPLQGGEQRDVEAEAPFSGLR